MDSGSLSRTSQAVALTRAGMTRPCTAEGTYPEGVDSGQVAAALNSGRRHGDTEPWLTVMPVPAWLQLLAEAGWPAEGQGDQSDPSQGSVAEGRSLLVTARPSL
jgi:hypothetical protein